MSSNQSPTRKKAAAAAIPRRLRPTTARGPRYGVALSALFHGLIFLAVLFSFHRNFETPPDSHVVPVDLVTIANETNVTAQSPPVPQAETMDRPPPSALEAPPEPEMVEAEPAPVPPMPQFEVAREKPKPVEKPKPTRKAMQQDFNDLLNKLTTPDKPVKTAKTGPRAIQGVGAGNQMTADLADALKSQIYRCWSRPEGFAADRANDLVVEFDLELGPDGRVIRADSASVSPGNPSRYNYAAGIAARNAIYQCQPYRLPPERYNQWREINPMRFDPRQNP
ncbi:MAG: cell envelope integrity protein TolA [Rhizomicrobium sp.]